MKKYFIIFDTHPHKVDWSLFYNPDKHELFLMLIPQNIGLPTSLLELKKKNQLKYFSELLKLKNFKFTNLKAKVAGVIKSLEKSGVKKNNIEIITDGELCLMKAARLREHFKLKGAKPKDVIHFRNKILAKKKLSKAGLERCLPKYLVFDGKKYKKNPSTYISFIIKKLGFPIFAKPIDLVSSVNIKKIENITQLKEWCKENKDSSFMELDEYIDGKAYHCDSMIKNKKIVRFDIGEKINPSADFISGKPNGSLMLSKTDPIFKKIASFNKKILKVLSPPDGCTDMDVFLKKNGQLIFIECAARTPSEFIPEMYKMSTGVDYYQAHYQLQMQLKVQYIANTNMNCAWIVIPEKKGILKKRYNPPNLSSQNIIKWNRNAGDSLQDPINLINSVCTIFLSNKNYQNLKSDIKKIINHTFYCIDQQNHKDKFIQKEKKHSISSINKKFSNYIRNLFDS